MAYCTPDRAYAHAGSAAGIGSVFTAAVRSYAAPAPAPSRGFRTTLVSALGAVRDWNDRRLTRRSLMALTDRELDDIGLHRGDIDAVARR